MLSSFLLSNISIELNIILPQITTRNICSVTLAKFVTSPDYGNFDQLYLFWPEFRIIGWGLSSPELLVTWNNKNVSSWEFMELKIIIIFDILKSSQNQMFDRNNASLFCQSINQTEREYKGMFCSHQYHSLSSDFFVIYIICFIQSISAKIFCFLNWNIYE